MKPCTILLVRPPGRFVSTGFPDAPMVAPPRNLLHLAQAVRDLDGVQVHIIDCLAEPDFDAIAKDSKPFLFGLTPQMLEERARALQPDIIGVTNMANYFQRETLDCVRALRRAAPKATIMLGGPDPTTDDAFYLEALPECDLVVRREGEVTFRELVQKIQARKGWKKTAGISYKGPKGIVRTEDRPFQTDLDPLVPDYDLLDLERYFDLAKRGFRSRITFQYPGVERTVDVVTSRGCPYKCSFCSIHLSHGRPFRSQSAEVVLAHLDTLVNRHGVRHVHFEDDIFNLDKKRFKAIMKGLIERRWKLTWDTPNGIRVDLLDEECVELAVASGCSYMVFGVESGNQRVLDEIVHKDLRLEDVERAARWCQDAGLDTLAFYIIGFPGETPQEMDDTVSFAFDLYKRYGTAPVLQVWRPYVGTDLEKDAVDKGLVKDAKPFELHSEFGIPYTLFRDRVLEDEGVRVQDVARRFQQYQRDGLRRGLARWSRVALREPGLLGGAAKAGIQAAARVVKHPETRDQELQKFMFDAGLYPHCMRRGVGVG